jgi:hypothetical protein
MLYPSYPIMSCHTPGIILPLAPSMIEPSILRVYTFFDDLGNPGTISRTRRGIAQRQR